MKNYSSYPKTIYYRKDRYPDCSQYDFNHAIQVPEQWGNVSSPRFSDDLTLTGYIILDDSPSIDDINQQISVTLFVFPLSNDFSRGTISSMDLVIELSSIDVSYVENISEIFELILIPLDSVDDSDHSFIMLTHIIHGLTIHSQDYISLDSGLGIDFESIVDQVSLINDLELSLEMVIGDNDFAEISNIILFDVFIFYSLDTSEVSYITLSIDLFDDLISGHISEITIDYIAIEVDSVSDQIISLDNGLGIDLDMINMNMTLISDLDSVSHYMIIHLPSINDTFDISSEIAVQSLSIFLHSVQDASIIDDQISKVNIRSISYIWIPWFWDLN